MQDDNVREIASAVELLTQRVEQSAASSVPGAQLGELLHQTHPGLLDALGVKLVRFLDLHAPRLSIVGRSGIDLLWGVRRDADAPWPDLDTLLREDDAHRPEQPPPEVKLRHVRLEEFRSIRDVTLELDPVTVLIGPNGAGKSNLLDGVFRGTELLARKPATVFQGPDELTRITRRGAAKPLQITLQGSPGWSARFSAGAAATAPFTVEVDGEEQDEWSLAMTPLRAAFGPAVRLHLSATALARPSWSDAEEPWLGSDGSLLPTVLAHLAGADPHRLREVLAQVQALVPQVEDVRTLRKRIEVAETEVVRVDDQELPRIVKRTRVHDALEVKIARVGWIPADQLSEGTLFALGLHTMLAREVRPKLLLIDDLDRALHPTAQRTLVGQLQRLTETGLRVLATSHSPFVLDPLPPSAIRVVQIDADGATVIRRLTDHSDWPRWEGAMTPAEFWQYAGDEWARSTP